MKKLRNLLIVIVNVLLLNVQIANAQVCVPDSVADRIMAELLRKDYLERIVHSYELTIYKFEKKDSTQVQQIVFLKRKNQAQEVMIYGLKGEMELTVKQLKELERIAKRNRWKDFFTGVGVGAGIYALVQLLLMFL